MKDKKEGIEALMKRLKSRKDKRRDVASSDESYREMIDMQEKVKDLVEKDMSKEDREKAAEKHLIKKRRELKYGK